MMLNVRYIFWMVIVALFCACKPHYQDVNLEDFSVDIYTPKYAEGFAIRSLPDSTATLLEVAKPWQGDVARSQNLLIINENTASPEGFEGAVLRGAARRVIALSSSNIAMFEAIGVSDRVVGVSGIQYISNPNIVDSYNAGRTLDIGYGSELNFEAIIALRPDIVLLYGVAGEDVGVTSKLKELGIQYIYIGDYVEESPLGKAEWMVAMGEICGLRDLAAERFGEIVDRYVAIQDSLEVMLQGADSVEVDNLPRVMLNTPYRDVWYMPSAKSYMVRLVEDAGGVYLYPENSSNSTQPISLERAYELVTRADVWLNLGATTRSVEALKVQNPIFAEMDVVARGELYNATARSTEMGGSDFWESGVVRADLVLSDLVKILHPEAATDHELYYYEKLE